ncbi:D-2-hydroxyacid dehydrogenase [Staphylothermus hellenicus]|uniref:D-isomer specific 2-hydroxyacid dehydrogenase NAD-binding protein n=1 Tax=Staphylothermus hellenicus (strain DSM 12710 / JCM 10830 / BK20S6-10-b1 / P8) TaxID=591019 RepID=D7DB32_STAHD|nr:D-2-hydroxyacid dehydrogenase [Staphylothermus hellenicus]ADI31379.1 D-isomer specific 2-hydroxyacid dehydrogenase NAD-binding protein [Staphylothermus hellenicus DSM 12710]
MVKILVAAPIHEKALEKLRNAGFQIVYEEYPSEDRLVELIKDVDAIIVRSKPKVTRRVIEVAEKLKVIARAGVGLDNIDLDAANEKGIQVFNAPSAPTQSVAELAIGLMIDVLRKIAFADRKMREGAWAKKQCLGRELRGKVLGIIGMGRIGTAVARIAYHGLGMKIIYYDARRCPKDIEKEIEAKCVDLDTLLKTADIVSIHVPLVPATKHLINEEKLRLMKKTAILINTARGGVVDTNALVKALKEGWIAGAGLDVFEEEPLPPEHPLTKLDNVVLTPHIGASTVEAQERAGVEVVEKIIGFFKGSSNK